MSGSVKEIHGRTQNVEEVCNFTWSIKNFGICSIKGKEYLLSPKFSTGESLLTKWHLKLVRRENYTDKSDGISMGIYLIRTSTDSSAHYAIFNMSIMNVNKEKSKKVDFEFLYDKPECSYGTSEFIDRDELLNGEETLLPNDTLTVLCELNVSRLEDITSELTVRAETNKSYIIKNLGYLARNYQNLYETEIFSDFTLKVGEEELKVHKNVLCARSSVFYTMLNCDMKENLTNCVEIPDFDPPVEKTMVRYIYCGLVHDLNPKMSIQLYSIADKYNIPDLKNVCVAYISRNLNIDNICAALVLGELYNEPQVKKAAGNFICMNAAAIQETEKWLSLSETQPGLVLSMNRLVISQRKEK